MPTKKGTKQTKKVDVAFWCFIGVSRPFRLEVELPRKRLNKFCDEYEQKSRMRPSDHHPAITCIGERKKWGVEYRIYFNCIDVVKENLNKTGLRVEEGFPYRAEYRYRVNSEELFWALIEYGFHLGDNP